MVITAAEGANAHLADLKRRPQDFDPLTRDRFLAGALVPAAVYVQAQRFRAWYRAAVADLFGKVDVLLAPTTPCPAPRIGQDRIVLDGVEVLIRPNLGVYTQPLSFIGLPVLSVRRGRPAAEGFAYVATFLAMRPAGLAAPPDWADLAGVLQAEADAGQAGGRAGVTTLGRGGVLARLLCPSAPALQAVVHALWGACRQRLLGLAPARLRKL